MTWHMLVTFLLSLKYSHEETSLHYVPLNWNALRLFSYHQRTAVMSEANDDISRFKKWLEANGAKFPKVEWPSLDTTGGVRGATAIDNIATNEVMIEIPNHIMMSPPVAFASDIGSLLRQNSDILRTDLLLSVFIMSERSKGERSFFYPFLRILPVPGTVANWDDKDLLHLQDDALHVRAKGRLILVESTYNRTVVALSQRSPNEFPLDKFSFENFKFSWFSIMARAFGKRLPWTALVPFADCLNHGNLQTKYDYDVNDNGLFRLFPSGSNSYLKGSEVFNSYGRRANDNLLLDYGFAMLDNEWDTFEVMLTLPSTSPLYDEKKDILNVLGYSSSLSITMNKKNFPVSALAFLRVVLLTAAEVEHLLQMLPITTSSHDAQESASFLNISQRANFLSLRDEKRRIFGNVLSLINELAAIQFLSSMLTAVVSSRETSTQEDEEILKAMASGEHVKDVGPRGNVEGDGGKQGGDVRKESGAGKGSVQAKDESNIKKSGGVEEDEKWKLQCAVTYRLTRKRIIDTNLEKLAIVEMFLTDRARLVQEADGDHPEDLNLRFLSISSECPFVPLIMKKRATYAVKERKMKKKYSAEKIVLNNAINEVTDISMRTIIQPSNLKTPSSDRDSLSLKAALDLYVEQVNSPNLSFQITKNP